MVIYLSLIEDSKGKLNLPELNTFSFPLPQTHVFQDWSSFSSGTEQSISQNSYVRPLFEFLS